MNIGFDKEEIAQLRAECAKEGKPYIIVEDEEDMSNSGQVAHFQFVGVRHGQEVIYDILMTTLEMEYELELYDAAMESISEELKMNKITDEKEIEERMDEAMSLIEEEEGVKVCEQLTIDDDFDYGIGVEYIIHAPEIDDKLIQKFIKEFSNGSVKLDKTMYSFNDELE